MVYKHVRSDQEISAKSKSMTSARARRQTLFGEPLLLEGEDRRRLRRAPRPRFGQRLNRPTFLTRCSRSTSCPWSGRSCGGAV